MKNCEAPAVQSKRIDVSQKERECVFPTHPTPSTAALTALHKRHRQQFSSGSTKQMNLRYHSPKNRNFFFFVCLARRELRAFPLLFFFPLLSGICNCQSVSEPQLLPRESAGTVDHLDMSLLFCVFFFFRSSRAFMVLI